MGYRCVEYSVDVYYRTNKNIQSKDVQFRQCSC